MRTAGDTATDRWAIAKQKGDSKCRIKMEPDLAARAPAPGAEWGAAAAVAARVEDKAKDKGDA